MYLCDMKQDDLIWEFLPSGLQVQLATFKRTLVVSFINDRH